MLKEAEARNREMEAALRDAKPDLSPDMTNRIDALLAHGGGGKE